MSDEKLIALATIPGITLGPLKSIGVTYFSDAFDLESIVLGEKLIQNKYFYRVFVRYISSFTNDLTQLDHRAQIDRSVEKNIVVCH